MLAIVGKNTRSRIGPCTKDSLQLWRMGIQHGDRLRMDFGYLSILLGNHLMELGRTLVSDGILIQILAF